MVEPKATRKIYNKGEFQVWEWSDVGSSDELGTLTANFVTACAQVVGNFSGATVSFEASLDESTFGPILRFNGESPTIKSSSVIHLAGPIMSLRPKLMGGDKNTKISIRIAAPT